MESKKRDWDQITEKKTITRSCYNNRKQCIKKKTMELATLCGINACTIIYGADGEVESWPENPTAAKAIIKNFKDMTNNPYKRSKVRDESKKKDVVVPGGEVESCLENPTAAKGIIQKFEYLLNDPYQKTTIPDESGQKEDFVVVPDGETHSWPKTPRGSNRMTEENAESGHLRKTMQKRLLYLSRLSLTEYQDFLMQLESKLEALTRRLVFLRKDKKYDTNSMEKKQSNYSEKTSQERTKISQTPLFPFDLNYPPPDEAEYCSPLSSEDYNEPRL